MSVRGEDVSDRDTSSAMKVNWWAPPPARFLKSVRPGAVGRLVVRNRRLPSRNAGPPGYVTCGRPTTSLRSGCSSCHGRVYGLGAVLRVGWSAPFDCNIRQSPASRPEPGLSQFARPASVRRWAGLLNLREAATVLNARLRVLVGLLAPAAAGHLCREEAAGEQLRILLVFLSSSVARTGSEGLVGGIQYREPRPNDCTRPLRSRARRSAHRTRPGSLVMAGIDPVRLFGLAAGGTPVTALLLLFLRKKLEPLRCCPACGGSAGCVRGRSRPHQNDRRDGARNARAEKTCGHGRVLGVPDRPVASRNARRFEESRSEFTLKVLILYDAPATPTYV